MTEQERELIELYRSLPEKDRKIALAMLRGIAEYGDNPTRGLELPKKES